MEDGEVNDGFLGDEEMTARKALASVHGEGTGMSWVEAVILGAGHVSADDDANNNSGDYHRSSEHANGQAQSTAQPIVSMYATVPVELTRAKSN